MGVELRILLVADTVPDEAWLTHTLRGGVHHHLRAGERQAGLPPGSRPGILGHGGVLFSRRDDLGNCTNLVGTVHDGPQSDRFPLKGPTDRE
jgi:hypothetical protein